MKSLTRTKLLGLLLAAALVYLAAHYAWPHMQSLTGQADQVTVDTLDLSQRAHAAEAVKAQQSRYDAKSAAYAAAIPDAPRLTDVINRLQGMASTAGLQWLSGVPQPASDAGNTALHAWTVSMSLSGPPAGVSSFLDEVRGDARLFVVDSVTINSNDATHTTSTVIVRAFSTGTDLSK